jgi:hypothetical protein
MTTPKPTVGRVVHYVNAGHSLGTYSSTCRAAIVTDVKDDVTISLCVFTPKGNFFYEELAYDAGKAGGTWHWPEITEGPTSSILPATSKSPRRT